MTYSVKIGTSDQYLYEIVVTAYCKKQAIDEGVRKVKRYYTESGRRSQKIIEAEAYPQGFRMMHS